MTTLARSCAAAVLCLALSARADDEEARVKITEKDYAALHELDFARALAAERKFRSGADAAKKARADEELAKAFAKAGWTQEKLDELRHLLSDAVQYLSTIDEGGENGDSAKESLQSLDPVTVATARAHRKEI